MTVHRSKLAEILRAYDIAKETAEAIIMLYTDMQSLVFSPDGDTEFFSISAGILQGDTLEPLIFILTLNYVLRMSLDITRTLVSP